MITHFVGGHKVRCHTGAVEIIWERTPRLTYAGPAPFEKCLSMWSILWSRFHICKSFKSCWIKSCYMRPTKPPSALRETVPLWCATRCGSISAGWNCERVRSVTAKATRGSRKPTRKPGVGNRRPRGRKNSPRSDCPRRSSALPVCRARQNTTGPRAHPEQRHRLSVHSHGCAYHFYDSRRAIGSGSE
jgi:hypothetical protein